MINNQFMNINPVQLNQQQICQNNNMGNNIINVYFRKVKTDKTYNIQSNNNEVFSEVIKRYRQRANDFNDNLFLLNGRTLDPSSKLSLDNIEITNFSYITVVQKCDVTGSIEFIIKESNI